MKPVNTQTLEMCIYLPMPILLNNNKNNIKASSRNKEINNLDGFICNGDKIF